MGCHFLLQGIFLTQGSNPYLFYLLHWQVDSLPLHHLGSPVLVLRAATVNYHKPGDLSHINSFCHSSGGKKSEIKVDSARSEGFKEESLFPSFWCPPAVPGILWLWQHPVSACVFKYLLMRTLVIWFSAHPMGASLVVQMVKNPPAMQRPGFDPWVRKIPWRREWQPTLVLLPGEFHGQRTLTGYTPWGQRIRHNWEMNTFTNLMWLYLNLVNYICKDLFPK